MSTVTLFAECFSTVDIQDSFMVTPCVSLWRRWMEEKPNATRLFLRIHHPTSEDDTFLVPVGDPVQTVEMNNALYLPMWMIDTNKYEGAGEEAVVELIEASSLPSATRIVLRAVDSTLHEVDVVSVFERSFSRLGVLQQGKQYLIPLEELGGFQVSVFVERLEPGPEVYLDGDDVPLEFETAVDYVEPPVSVPRSPSLPQPSEDFDNHAMIHSESLIRPKTNQAFVPFTGRGYTLGDK